MDKCITIITYNTCTCINTIKIHAFLPKEKQGLLRAPRKKVLQGSSFDSIAVLGSKKVTPAPTIRYCICKIINPTLKGWKRQITIIQAALKNLTRMCPKIACALISRKFWVNSFPINHQPLPGSGYTRACCMGVLPLSLRVTCFVSIVLQPLTRASHKQDTTTICPGMSHCLGPPHRSPTTYTHWSLRNAMKRYSQVLKVMIPCHTHWKSQTRHVAIAVLLDLVAALASAWVH